MVHKSSVKILFLLFFAIQLNLSNGTAKDKTPRGKSQKKKIAITFDELPAARTFDEIDREAVTYLLLTALKKHKVKATGFVVGEQIENSYDLLGRWLNDGHALGNMSFSGQDYNQLSPEQFIRDIRRGERALEPMLSGFGQKKRYFRYPFLHYGEDVEHRRPTAEYLEVQDVIVAPATVIPEDYLYNLTLIKLGKLPDSVKYEQLLNDYINHVLDELLRVETLSKEMFRRPVRQILRLRTNRLNAVFLDELLAAIRSEGYTFVTLDYALKDSVYSMSEAYYGLKGIGYLDMIQQSNPDLIPAE